LKSGQKFLMFSKLEVGYLLSVDGYGLWAMGYGLWAMGYELKIRNPQPQ